MLTIALLWSHRPSPKISKRSIKVNQPVWNWKRCWHNWVAGVIVLAAGMPGAQAQAPMPPPLPQETLPQETLPQVALPQVALPQAAQPAAREKTPRKFLPMTNRGLPVLPVAATQEPAAPEPLPEPATNGHGVLSGGCANGRCAGGGCANGGCANGRCVPGRTRDCSCCNWNSFCGRLVCNLYEELCCPDPCYEPKWLPIANAAFFVEGTRPVTTTIIRYDAGRDYLFPDRSEFFWARSDGGGKGPKKIENRLRYDQISMYTEVAAKAASVFTEIPYLSIDPDVNPHAAGFGDMKVGTKVLLFDRDLLQVGFMFKTYLPVGNFTKGLGTGHVSLEPSLLGTLKICPSTYFQSQVSEWIPIAGDPAYAGSILHYHVSLNQVLCKPLPDVLLIGTAEFNGYSFQDGLFSDPVLGQFQKSSSDSYLSAGPGVRLSICDWLDFGAAAAFAFGHRGPEQVWRAEFRIRY